MTAGDGFLASLSVAPLPPDFSADDFDCGEPDLTDYLCDGTAAHDETTGVSRTYLVWSREELVGYFTILADSIQLKGKERPEGVRYPTAPALKLGRMGVHQNFQGRRVGYWILDFVVGMARELSHQVGIRYVTLDAMTADRLVAWYESYGFVRNLGESERLIAWLKFVKRMKPGDPLHRVSMRFDILLEEELERTHQDRPPELL